ncbi:MAG: acylphosphatase [Candidatus Sericytochromatia bacterium]|nr:acylphosphatase [Candidatus Tanganyikabacteria bacterium]
MSGEDVRVHALVCGRVQGVWYRQSTCERAGELGVTGWVRNLPDGRVEILAEGSRPAVEALLEWARQGPPLAAVDRVDTHWEAPTGDFQAFRVR